MNLATKWRRHHLTVRIEHADPAVDWCLRQVCALLLESMYSKVSVYAGDSVYGLLGNAVPNRLQFVNAG